MQLNWNLYSKKMNSEIFFLKLKECWNLNPDWFQGNSKSYTDSDQYSLLLKLDWNGFVVVACYLVYLLPPVFYHTFPINFSTFSRNSCFFSQWKNFPLIALEDISQQNHRHVRFPTDSRIQLITDPEFARASWCFIPIIGSFAAGATAPGLSVLPRTFTASLISWETVQNRKASDSPPCIQMPDHGWQADELLSW